jgi:WD40 repeat protein
MVRRRPAGPRGLRQLTLVPVLVALLLVASASCSSSDPDSSGDGDDGPEPAGGDVDRVPGVVVQPDAAALSPDGLRIVVPCQDDLCVWDTRSGSLEDTYPGGDVVAWSPPGDLVATSGLDEGAATVVLIDAETGEVVRTLAGHTVDAAEDVVGAGISDVAFNADGTTLASAGDDGMVRLWSVSDGELLAELATQSSTPDALAFDSGGGRLAVAAPDAPVEIWDVSSGDRVATLDVEPQGQVAWSPDGLLLATATNATGVEATVRLWDAETLTEQAHYDKPMEADGLAFSPDSTILAMSQKQAPEIWLWPVSGGDVRRLSGPDESMRAVLWAPDGSRLYAVAARAGVLAWDAATGDLAGTFELP